MCLVGMCDLLTCVWFAYVKFEKYMRLLFHLGFFPCKAQEPLQGMELQEEEVEKD